MWGLSSWVTQILWDVHSSTTGWRLSETEPRSRERRSTLTSGPASHQTLPGERGPKESFMGPGYSYLVWILHDAIIVITSHYTGHNTKIQTNFGIIIRSSGPRCPALKPKLEIQSPCMTRQNKVESLITFMMSSDERVTWWSLQVGSALLSTAPRPLAHLPPNDGCWWAGGGTGRGEGEEGAGRKTLSDYVR